MLDRITHTLRAAEAWLDRKGRGAWIAAMILGFVVVWPIGLAILAYMIWSNRMSCSTSKWHRSGAHRFAPTGNVAFDEYRAETIRRLEEEQGAFQGFMDRLRRAKDQAEFDQFMADRRRGPGDAEPAA